MLLLKGNLFHFFQCTKDNTEEKQFLVNTANDSDIDEKPPVTNERESLVFD